MSTSISIKKDLFRFMTARTPNHLSQASKMSNFVYHPDISQSAISFCPIPSGDRVNPLTFQQYLNGFQPVASYKDIQNINTAVYNFSDQLFRIRKNKNYSYANMQQPAALAPHELIKIWDQLFYQIMARTSKYIRQACIQMIIADNLLQQSANPNFDWRVAANSKVIIPQEVLRCFKPWLVGNCGGELHGVNKLGIADFRRVEQEVCCYLPGEVSHIENIVSGEYKERSTRNLIRTEYSVETSRETEMENVSDTTSTTRNELSSEIASVLDEEHSANYGGSLGVSGEYMKVKIDVNAYADFASSNSSSYSNTNAKNYAEEITKRALERIVRKTSEKRTSKIIKEFEENNKHGYDNRGNKFNVSGVYRWVDVIYTNRLINYGKRLMFEFLIPEPAAFYKEMLTYKPKPKTATGTPPPPDPKTNPALFDLAHFGISNAASINEDTNTSLELNDAAAYFGVQIPTLPPKTKTINRAFAPASEIDRGGPTTYNNPSFDHDVMIETEYLADKFESNFRFEYKSQSGLDAYFIVNIGGKSSTQDHKTGGRQWTSSYTHNEDFNPDISTLVDIQVTTFKCYNYQLSVLIYCVLKPSIITDWQNDVYNMLLAAYNSKKDEFDNKASDEVDAAAQESENKENATPPGMKRIIEQRELKRACIDMVTRPFCREEGKSLKDMIDACGKYNIPKIKLDASLDAYAEQVTFFEQAFDWSIMSYLFYPYYWADKCDWGDLFLSQDDDLIFQAFKQAGMARVVVPIRPEFTEAVMYYLETGDIWLGGDLVVETDDDRYLSLAEELQTVDGVVEEEWETRMPTTLTLLQDDPAGLDEGGLPCCHKVETADALQINTIKKSTHRLQMLGGSTGEADTNTGDNTLK